jgi:hypothetical protein
MTELVTGAQVDASKTNGVLIHATDQPALEGLPREVGVLLVTVGFLGLVLPGPIGTPFLLAGGLALWPNGFRSADRWVRAKFPRLHREGMEQLERYLHDLERRYPGSTRGIHDGRPQRAIEC